MDAQTGGTTGFYQWCALVLRWQVIVEQNQTPAAFQQSSVIPESLIQFRISTPPPRSAIHASSGLTALAC